MTNYCTDFETIYGLVKNNLPNSGYKIVRVLFPITTASDTETVYDFRFDGYYYKLHTNNIKKRLIAKLRENNISTEFYDVQEKIYVDPNTRKKAGTILEMSLGIKEEPGCIVA